MAVTNWTTNCGWYLAVSTSAPPRLSTGLKIRKVSTVEIGSVLTTSVVTIVLDAEYSEYRNVSFTVVRTSMTVLVLLSASELPANDDNVACTTEVTTALNSRTGTTCTKLLRAR